MKKYLDYVVIGIREHMAYPSAIWAKFFSKVIYLYLQFSIWNALFLSNEQMDSLLKRDDILNYIIVATIISTFIECNIIEWMNEHIRTGNIVTELIRPINFRKMVFFRHLGGTIVKIVFYCSPLSILVGIVISKPLLCYT